MVPMAPISLNFPPSYLDGSFLICDLETKSLKSNNMHENIYYIHISSFW